jgi:hypothetical protein
MQAKMANADKACGQDMREEATDEFEGGQGHDFLCALVAVVEVFEGNGVFANGQDAMVGDGNTEDTCTALRACAVQVCSDRDTRSVSLGHRRELGCRLPNPGIRRAGAWRERRVRPRGY